MLSSGHPLLAFLFCISCYAVLEQSSTPPNPMVDGELKKCNHNDSSSIKVRERLHPPSFLNLSTSNAFTDSKPCRILHLVRNLSQKLYRPKKVYWRVQVYGSGFRVQSLELPRKPYKPLLPQLAIARTPTIPIDNVLDNTPLRNPPYAPL